MTIARKLTSIATAAALAATAVAPMTTAASAEGWRNGRGGGDYAYARSERRDWDGGHRRHHRYGHRHRHDNTGKYIALGVGALMLGIIASEAARH